MQEYTNALISESSPYLLQHAHNPVNWYPWGSEALEKAKKEDKLILVSIGYSACHWCHVMEHESFEDKEVADIMNQHFICIKVDREERPDIDHIYMTAVQLMNSQGGWPLNCFTLPDQRPVYGGTYFRKNDWKNILLNLANLYREKPDELNEFASRLTEGIHKVEKVLFLRERDSFKKETLKGIFEVWKDSFDYNEGGHKRAPKFPMPNNFLFLLRFGHLLKDEAAHAIVKLTLKKMASGGIYDQVGGGFARYSTDESWKVPHFEKMLYDNAQLVSLYSEAWQAFREPLYKDVVYETLGFVERELLSPEGGFYSALDADSEGQEGKFYTWRLKELTELLGPDVKLFSEYFNVTENGNWENEINILYKTKTTEEIAEKAGLTPRALKEKVLEWKQVLLESRERRVRPGLDDKILASWNGMMLKAYVDAYRVFGEIHFLEIAVKNAHFIEQYLLKNGRLLRNYKNGKANILAFLDDYAFIAEAFIELYQATFDERWLQIARELAEAVITYFYDRASGMFFYKAVDDEPLIARKLEINDNVIPASNSVMAHVFHKLGIYYEHEPYEELAVQMLNNMLEKLNTYPSAYSNWSSLLLSMIFKPFEVAVTGEHAQALRREIDEAYIPDKLLFGGKSSLPFMEDKPAEKGLIFVCREKTCKMPVETAADAIRQMHIS